MLVHPAGDGDQQKPEWIQDSRHLDSPLLRALDDGWQSAQIQTVPIFGPYAVSVAGRTAGMVTRAVALDAEKIRAALRRMLHGKVDEKTRHAHLGNDIVALSFRTAPTARSKSLVSCESPSSEAAAGVDQVF